MTSSLTDEFTVRDEVIFMQKIMMPTEETKNFLEVFEMFVISQSAKGVTDVTLRNYRYHMKNIANYLDVNRSFDDVTKRDIETMVAAMRRSGMAHNSIATYMRMLRTFYKPRFGWDCLNINIYKPARFFWYRAALFSILYYRKQNFVAVRLQNYYF